MVVAINVFVVSVPSDVGCRSVLQVDICYFCSWDGETVQCVVYMQCALAVVIGYA